MKKNIYNIILLLIAGGVLISCDDFLDKEPQSKASPEFYFTDASQLMAYADEMYSRILPSSYGNSYGFFAQDAGTDNQVPLTAPDRFYEGQWRVPHDGGNWSFEVIYRCNVFFSQVNPRFGEDLSGSANTIGGDLKAVRHYIGEMYFLRAAEYFKRYQKFGDFPIITEPLADDMAILTEASKRSPRNEVARFILSDLDKAAELMNGVDYATVRINRDVALLLKSRVALFEATWLKYFKGTAFVPNGEGWPGKAKDYNANYQFPSGSIENEINFFLDEAMIASKEVADKYELTNNTGVLQQSLEEPANPYFDMFAAENMSSYAEILLWKKYVSGVNGHDVCMAVLNSNWAVGLTRGYVQNFLMKDGTPVYTHGSYADGDGYYKGDKDIRDLPVNRDTRLGLFLKTPGQKNLLTRTGSDFEPWAVEPSPRISAPAEQQCYNTGYALRKGGAWDGKYCYQNSNYTGIPIYRAAEALLNYLEASYERNGSLDNSAREYWEKLRTRAGIEAYTIDATIAATDISKEAENDWAAYSGGTLLADKTLYNIRRERRCELLSEGFRYMDLCRWRAMDQITTTPYIPEGMHLWNTPMADWYIDNPHQEVLPLLADGSDKANVSSPDRSEYVRPYQKNPNQRCYNGFVWKMAHYLEPVRIDQMMITAPNGKTVSDSPIYQNPYWPTEANNAALQ
jgi:hypothetical protein